MKDWQLLVGMGEDAGGCKVVTLGITEAGIEHLAKDGSKTHTVDLRAVGLDVKIILHRGKDRQALRKQLGEFGRGGGELDLGIK